MTTASSQKAPSSSSPPPPDQEFPEFVEKDNQGKYHFKKLPQESDLKTFIQPFFKKYPFGEIISEDDGAFHDFHHKMLIIHVFFSDERMRSQIGGEDQLQKLLKEY